MRESTRMMLKKHGWRLDRFAHNYVYFLYYAPYVAAARKVATVAGRYFSWLKPLSIVGRMVFNRYHSKVLSGEDARKILTLDRDLARTGPINKSIVPYRYAHAIILKEPDFIAVMDCPCKKSAGLSGPDINCCIAVGRGLASFWLEHCGKYHARKISGEEALRIIAEKRAGGHVTQAFFKVATGGSTGVICNCHPEHCVSLTATRFVKRIDPSLSMNAPSGYAVSRDESLCRACGECARICPAGAVTMKEGARAVRAGACLGCGLCVEHCPEGALSLVPGGPGLPEPLDLERIFNAEKNAGASSVQRHPMEV